MIFEEKLITIDGLFRDIKSRCKKEALGKENLERVTMAQLEYLIIIHRLGTPSFSQLSEEMGLSKASVTIAVNKLIKQDFLYKEQSDQDSRVYYIHLGENSYKLLKAEHKSHQNFADIIKGCLSDKELAQLDKIYGKIIAELDR